MGISAGAAHVCALRANGAVFCWGSNSRGQIGNNSTLNSPNPAQVVGLTDALGASAGGLVTCASRTFGGASCWKGNSAGELSTRDSLDHLTPSLVVDHFVTVNGVRVPVALGGVAAITAGTISGATDDEQVCSLESSGRLLCWGGNDLGQIGDATNTERPLPTTVLSFTANVEPAVTLTSQSRIAQVTALIDCQTGAEAHQIMTLAQGGVSGTSRRSLRAALYGAPADGSSRARKGWVPTGPAVATVEAIVKSNGEVIEDQHWTRAVTLSIQ